MQAGEYPVQFAVDYPDRELDRLTTAFRIIVAIPIMILVASISVNETIQWGEQGRNTVVAGGGFLFLAPLLMIVFRRKYPRWWFDWNLQLARLNNRLGAYLALMDDRYPSTDDEQSVHLDLPYPNVPEDLNRWLPLVKWLLALPHYVVLAFLYVALFITVIVSWFAILVGGRYPRGLFDFAEGVMRWTNRVVAYSLLLLTDRYPPFRLTP
jgi:hypothetical protein